MKRHNLEVLYNHPKLCALNYDVDADDGRAVLRHFREAHAVVEVEEYEASGGWRWRLEDPGNHKNLCSPGQAFHDRDECRENFRRIHRLVGGTHAILWLKVEG